MVMDLLENTKQALLALIYFFSSGAEGVSNTNHLKVPEGFKVSVYEDNVPGARSLTRAGHVIFVGTRRQGKVYALLDTNKDFKVDQVHTLLSNLHYPNGVAFQNGSLYVAEIFRVLRYDRILKNLKKPPKPVVVYDGLPHKIHHGWRYIKFHPKNHNELYIGVGAPCNVCEKKAPFATILRLNVKTLKTKVVAKGVRNSVGFDWHPHTGRFWFTDNGRDWLGDDSPPCELNELKKEAEHFGFPYCHGKAVSDPEFTSFSCKKFQPPQFEFPAHVAPLGMIFYTGRQFPKTYRSKVFVAEHGSWNRSSRVGYKVSLIDLKKKTSKDFLTGFLKKGDILGRPVDLLTLDDGSILISDDYAGVIYRVSYGK